MTRVIGRLTSIGLGKETTPGTPVAPTFWIPVRSLGYQDRQDMADNESGFGRIEGVQDSGITRQWADGDYEGKIFDISVGLELTGVFGQSPTSVQRTTTGVYDHTYTMLNSNQHRSLTVAVKDANADLRAPYGIVNEWNLETDTEDYVHRTMNLTSKKSATAVNTVAYTNENEFLPRYLTVKLATAVGGLDAASATEVRSISLNISKNAEALFALGNVDPTAVVNKQVTVSGSFEIYYDDTVIEALAKAGTRRAMRIEMLNTDLIIGTSGTHNPALRFDMPEVVFRMPDRNFDNADVVTKTFEFVAVLNLTAGYSIQARLTNANAGTNY